MPSTPFDTAACMSTVPESAVTLRWGPSGNSKMTMGMKSSRWGRLDWRRRAHRARRDSGLPGDVQRGESPEHPALHPARGGAADGCFRALDEAESLEAAEDEGPGERADLVARDPRAHAEVRSAAEGEMRPV